MPGVPDLGAPVETISQNFSSFSNNAEILISGWQNIAQYGDRNWQAKYFSAKYLCPGYRISFRSLFNGYMADHSAGYNFCSESTLL